MIAAAIPAQADRPPLTPPAPPAPAPTPAVAGDSVAVPVSPASAPTLTMAQVIESTLRHLSMLKLRVSAVTAVSRADDGWRVTAELLERKAVPDTSDLLGVYDLQLDAAGNVLRYERTHMRRRADLGR
jgi:Gas vesicle synthesis protein GvpO